VVCVGQRKVFLCPGTSSSRMPKFAHAFLFLFDGKILPGPLGELWCG